MNTGRSVCDFVAPNPAKLVLRAEQSHPAKYLVLSVLDSLFIAPAGNARSICQASIERCHLTARPTDDGFQFGHSGSVVRSVAPAYRTPH
jgi:hypothetical protein